jgi:uncharacterized protein (TIGR02145 family)
MNKTTLRPSFLCRYICIGVLTILTLTACEEKKKPSSEAADTPAAAESKIDYGSLTDSRDGKAYKTVKIGEQVWLAENLNYEAKGSLCYDNKKENCDKYGRLYDWNTANSICPSGWHLPTKVEWDNLVATVGGEDVADKKLNAKSGWNENHNGTDDFSFSALPGGFGYSGGDFHSVGDFGSWWSNSEYYENGAYNRYMGYSYDDGNTNYFAKFVLLSVRCVQGEAVAANTPVKLLASMTIKNSSESTTYKFEYDDKDRIIKFLYGREKPIETSTFTYNINGSVKMEGMLYYHDETPFKREFVRSGNKIAVIDNLELDTITVNKDGYIDKSERTRDNEGEGDGDPWVRTYKYLGNNLVKLTITGHSSETSVVEYKYDNKKSPFYHGNTPKWVLQHLFFLHWNDYGLDNNVIEIDYSGDSKSIYEYEYDSDGFPIKRTSSNGTTTFTYIGK